MAITIDGNITQKPNGTWQVSIPTYGNHWLLLDLDSSYDPNSSEPTYLFGDKPFPRGYWCYHETIVKVEDGIFLNLEEIIFRIKHDVECYEKAYTQIRIKIEALEGMKRTNAANRERIMSVCLFVWQRDHGKCVKCGSTEKLEFDHIIPVAKGGDVTERNIQLLCIQCHRSKGAGI